MESKHLTFVLMYFPDDPPYLREYLYGHLKGVGELLGIHQVRVTKIETDP